MSSMVILFKKVLRNKWSNVEETEKKSLSLVEATFIVFAFHTFSHLLTDFMMALATSKHRAYTSPSFGDSQKTYKGIFCG